MHSLPPLLAALVAAWLPVRAEGETPSPPCASPDAGIPAELASWIRPRLLGSGNTRLDLATAELRLGQAARVELRASHSVRYLAPPGRTPEPGGFGGLLRVEVREAGTYRIALDSRAWIDVLSAGAPVIPLWYGPGPQCSTMRKLVDFHLRPGVHVMQISGSPGPHVRVLALQIPLPRASSAPPTR